MNPGGVTGAPTFGDLIAPASTMLSPLPIVAALLAVAYLAGAIRLWRLRRGWPVWRTVAFLFGCLALAAVTALGVEDYGYVMLSVFMFQQLTLMMAIPPLLVLGSPGTLLLRATPHRGVGIVVRRWAMAALRSTAARWVLSPWIALPLFLASFYGLYLGNLADPLLRMPGGHAGLEVVFLVLGVVFTVPVLSSDPLPVRMGYAGRALDVFAEAALHVFFGVFLMMSTVSMVAVFADASTAIGVDPVADQQLAGGLAWSYGEAPTVLMLMFIMHRWFLDDTRRARAADRYADATGEADLTAYNDYLARLSRNGGRTAAPRDDQP